MTQREFILTTTNTIQNRKIKSYVKVVSGISVTGLGAFRDFFSSFTDFFGGKSGSYQKEFGTAKELALQELKDRAMELSADAVVGIKIDYENISSKGKSLIMVAATGTAVITEDIS